MFEIAGIDYERKYGRADVDYESWFSEWSKMLARRMTRSEILREMGVAQKETSRAAKSHHEAIKKTTSMSSNSQRRAHARNVVAASGEYHIALSGALEIHDLFPENAKEDS